MPFIALKPESLETMDKDSLALERYTVKRDIGGRQFFNRSVGVCFRVRKSFPELSKSARMVFLSLPISGLAIRGITFPFLDGRSTLWQYP